MSFFPFVSLLKVPPNIMSRRFQRADREQMFLLPPSVEDWVNEGHLVRFLQDCVEQFDLSSFYNAYKQEGGAPYDPKMMLTTMLYAWCRGIRSSRKIAEACREQIAFRWATGNLCPDHCAFARFFQRHGESIKELFAQVLYLCHKAGAIQVGQLYLDGSKVEVNASLSVNQTLEHIREEIKRIEEEMRKQDDADNASQASGCREDELPRELRTRQERLERLRQAKERLEIELAVKHVAEEKKASETPGGTPPSTDSTDLPKGTRKKKEKKEDKAPRANVTDPDSRIMKSRQGHLQGYNTQIVVTKEQFVIAQEVVQDENDLHLLEKMLSVVQSSLEKAGIEERPEQLAADAGYWRNDVDVVGLEQEGPELLIATCNPRNQPTEAPRGRIPKSASTKERMRRKLSTKSGRGKYKKRKETVEPVFGQLKDCLYARRFLRRGLEKVRREWSLLCSCLDLRKLFSWIGKRGQKLVEAIG